MGRHDEVPLPLSVAAVQLWALDEIKDSRPPKSRWVRRAGWREVALLVRLVVHALARRPQPSLPIGVGGLPRHVSADEVALPAAPKGTTVTG